MRIEHDEEAALQSHYDERLTYYSPLDSNSIPWLFRKLAPGLTNAVTLLDIGCGDGRLYRPWKAMLRGAGYIGVDYSPKRIQVAKRKYGSGFHAADLHLWPIPPSGPYISAMFEVLEHLQAPRAALQKYAAVGPVIGSVPIGMEYKAHLQVYEDVEHIEDALGVRVLMGTDKHAFFRKEQT